MNYLLLLIRSWLSSLFLYSGLLKLIHYRDGPKTIRGYRIWSTHTSQILGYVLPWIEIGTSLSLISRRYRWWGALSAATLGGSFSYVAQRILRQHTNVTCGCVGTSDDVINRTTLIRGLAILGSSVVLLGTHPTSTQTPGPRWFTWVALAFSLPPVGVALLKQHQQKRSALIQQKERQHTIDMLVSKLRVHNQSPS